MKPTLVVLCLTVAMCVGCSGGGSPVATTAQHSDANVVGGESDALFSGAQPWTADVSSAPKSDRSDAILATLANLGGWGNDNVLQADFSIPIFYADGSTPRMDVIGTDDYCFGGPDCDAVPAQMPVPEGANIEGSPDLSCDPSGNTDGQSDCHLLVADRDEHKLYETYQASKTGDAIAATGFFVWDLSKQYPTNLRGDQCTSADAAGFPIAALTPTADEVASGTIDHALRFVLPNDRMKADVYVPPATHAGGPESAEADAPPYGVRLRLKPEFDESGYSESARVVLAALKSHGMLLSDGGEIALTFADDRTSNAKWADLGIDAQTFSGIAVDQFDVVDLGEEIPLTYECVRNP
jgi:hypothetical protein